MSDERIAGSAALPSEKWMAVWVGLCFAYVSWVWTGLPFEWVLPAMAWLAVASLGFLLISRFLDPQPIALRFRKSGRLLGSLLCDPVAWAGAALLLLFAVQWRNAWWPVGVETSVETEWFTQAAPFQNLPAAVNAVDARLMFLHFLNALAIALCVRHGFQSRAGVRRLYLVALVNAVALAAFGIVQYFSTTDSIYWMWPRKRHFFASFCYENHAGQFFYLMFALAVGFTAYQVCRRRVSFNRSNVSRLILMLSTLFLSAVFSLSRTAIVFACGIFVAGSFYVARRLPSSIGAVHRAYLFVGLAALCISGLVLVSGTVGEDIHEDFFRRRPGATLLEQAYEARVWQWKAAADMWKSHPWFGVGSEGFRYYLPYYTPADKLNQLNKDHAGQVHNDAVQFLAEGGVIGAALLAAALAALVWPLVRRWPIKGEMVIFPVAGAVLVLIHGLFDLPFRNPAVLAGWVLVMAGSGRYAELLESKTTSNGEVS